MKIAPKHSRLRNTATRTSKLPGHHRGTDDSRPRRESDMVIVECNCLGRAELRSGRVAMKGKDQVLNVKDAHCNLASVADHGTAVESQVSEPSFK
jgi:hypothetical protein